MSDFVPGTVLNCEEHGEYIAVPGSPCPSCEENIAWFKNLQDFCLKHHGDFLMKELERSRHE